MLSPSPLPISHFQLLHSFLPWNGELNSIFIFQRAHLRIQHCPLCNYMTYVHGYNINTTCNVVDKNRLLSKLVYIIKHIYCFNWIALCIRRNAKNKMKILLQWKGLYSFHTFKIGFHTDTLPGLNKRCSKIIQELPNNGSCNSSEGTDLTTGWMVLGSNPSKSNKFFSAYETSTYSIGTDVMSRGSTGWKMTMSTHLHLDPRSRKNRAIFPLPCMP